MNLENYKYTCKQIFISMPLWPVYSKLRLFFHHSFS